MIVLSAMMERRIPRDHQENIEYHVNNKNCSAYQEAEPLIHENESPRDYLKRTQGKAQIAQRSIPARERSS